MLNIWTHKIPHKLYPKKINYNESKVVMAYQIVYTPSEFTLFANGPICPNNLGDMV